MSDRRLVYITTDDEEEARRIGRALVDERLAACTNALPGMRSCYRWQDRIEEGHECVLIAKTRAPLVDRLVARVRELHSYTVPCVVSLPIEDGNPAFLAWIGAETGE